MQRPTWLFDELAHAGAEHLDPASVDEYDRKAALDVDEEIALLRTLGLAAESTLVDLGAGTGALAVGTAPLCRRVVAVDVSPAMVAATRARAERAGAANVECVRAGFLSYEHRGERADIVYSRNALHHLPDFWKAVALERAAAMLRPGGILRLRDLVFSFAPAETDAVIDAWLAAAASDPRAGWARSELERHLREEHSTFSWLLEPMLARAGFELREAGYSPSRIFATYVGVKR